MGKRSSFERIERDFYPTPIEAVIPVVKYLPLRYDEPFAGDGALINNISKLSNCKVIFASDIEPQNENIEKIDFFSGQYKPKSMNMITNPPWDRKILHPTIEKSTKIYKNTWLLFDADWMHTKQSSEFMKYCRTIVSIGRVKWIPDSKYTGKDNCCWYHFVSYPVDTILIGR